MCPVRGALRQTATAGQYPAPKAAPDEIAPVQDVCPRSPAAARDVMNRERRPRRNADRLRP